MKRSLYHGLVAAAALVLMACSGQDVDEGEHVWKEQTRALERAEEAEKEIQEGFEQRAREIERQTR